MSSEYNPPQIPSGSGGHVKKVWNDPQPGRPRTGPDGERLGFADFIDIINPLQHIPVVSTVYRHITGDQISPGARLVGGTLMGGPVGLAVASANIISETTTGGDAGENLVAGVLGLPKVPPKPLPDPADAAPEPELPPTDGVVASAPEPEMPPASDPWGAPLPQGATRDVPASVPAPPVMADPGQLPPIPARRGMVMAANEGQPAPAAQPAASPAIAARQAPQAAPTAADAPLVGPRGHMAATDRTQFLPSRPAAEPAEPRALTGLSPLRPPGGVSLNGPLAMPLGDSPMHPMQKPGATSRTESERDDEEQSERERAEEAQWEADRRAAALALDKALRRATQQQAPPGSVNLSG